MESNEMTEDERMAYNRGATRWGIGCTLVAAVFAVWGLNFVRPNKEGNMPALSPAQAMEPDRKDLFSLTNPANACQYDDDVIAWKRDDRFATQLRVWCLEKSGGAEGDSVVVWTQAENQRFASRMVIDSEFYSQKVLLDGEETKRSYVDACGGDGFLGWSKNGGSYVESGVTKRGDGDKIQITGFYGGNLWCVGHDIYILQDAIDHNDNRPDHRLDIAKDVKTNWTL